MTSCLHTSTPSRFSTLSRLGDNIFSFLKYNGGDANRRPTLIYHSFFKGAGVRCDRHEIAGPVGRTTTDAIKAHEMQMSWVGVGEEGLAR